MTIPGGNRVKTSLLMRTGARQLVNCLVLLFSFYKKWLQKKNQGISDSQLLLCSGNKRAYLGSQGGCSQPGGSLVGCVCKLFYYCLITEDNMYYLVLLVLGLVGSVHGSVVNGNVVFQKTGTVSLTRTRWLVTFVIDLEPYERVINTVSDDFQDITDTAWQTISHYSDQEKQVFKKSLLQLGQELRTMRDTFTGLTESYVQYKTLQGRQKRSLLPFIGKGMHFLFGTVTDSDLRSVRQNVE